MIASRGWIAQLAKPGAPTAVAVMTRCSRVEFVDADQPHAAIVERHAAEPAVLLDGVASAAAGGQEQAADDSRLHVFHRQHTRHLNSPCAARLA